MPCNNGGRDQSDASISQGCQEYQKLRERHGMDSSLSNSVRV